MFVLMHFPQKKILYSVLVLWMSLNVPFLTIEFSTKLKRNFSLSEKFGYYTFTDTSILYVALM